jgi:mannose-6-phosphate isomerase-like protein (cupin superfamily)
MKKSMNRIATTLSIAAAFAAGCGVTHLLRPAFAAENIAAQIIHTGEMEGDALGAANKVGFRSKMFLSADGSTISIQDGNVPKHLHPNTNEIQYILEGTGTIWLGDKEVQIKPGDLIIIPKGTAHGGTKPDNRSVKAIAIKTPPQAPDDTKLLD